MARQHKSRPESARAILSQLRAAFEAYKTSIGAYHQASRGLASALAVGVIEDSYRALVRLVAKARVSLGLALPMPPQPAAPGQQGDWEGWPEWHDGVNRWWDEIGALFSAQQGSDPPSDSNELRNYIPAKLCRNGRITSPKQLTALLKRTPNDESGIRREYRGQHLLVHAADWMRWTAQQDEQSWEALDRTEDAITEAMASGRGRAKRKKKLGGQ
jgi:hypothetical protein